MYISPINIIKGLHGVIEANRENIDRVIRHYRSSDTLHIFDGLRKTLPMSAYPSLEFDPVSAGIEWTHTSAQTGEYQIECYLTVKNSDEEYSAEYISEVTRSILKVLNYPDNMCFRIPNEYYQTDDPENPYKYPIWLQFGNVSSVNYRNTIDGSLTVAMFTWSGRVLEYFHYKGDGPHTINWKHDVLIGTEEDETLPSP
jgi:hypothetical protein